MQSPFTKVKPSDSFIQIVIIFSLGLDCNLDKDLSKDVRDNQLVKNKNTREYLQLYIPNNHELYTRYP